MRTLTGSFLLFFFVFTASVLAEDIRYDKGDRRDPLMPLVGPNGVVLTDKFDSTDLKVEGIIYDPNSESLVLINGEFYKEGDHVNGANVITIFPDRVILEQSDEKKTIWIREEVPTQGEVPDEKKPAKRKRKK